MRRFRSVALGRISGRGLTATIAAAIVAAGARDAAAQADPSLIEEIGSVAAANEDVIGTPLERAQRQLSPGENLLLYERIETSDVGAGQFIFRDQTSMTVWPNSDIVLDEYIYDPARGAGSMALSMTRGVLRFIGGGISKTEDVTITTLHAVVAVRGGIAQVVVTEAGTTATLLAGDYLRVRGLQGTDVVTMSRSGATASVAAGAAEANFDGVSDPAAIAALFGLQTGEGDGGATQEVSETTTTPLLATTVRPLGSDDRRAPTRRPVSTRGERQVEPESAASPVDDVAQRAQEARQETTIAQEQDPETGSVEPADPTAPRPIPQASGARFAVADGVRFVAADGSVIEDPAASNIVFLGDAFTAIASAQQSSGEGGVIEGTDEDGQVVSLPSQPGFTPLVGADGEVIGQSFVSPDRDFAVQARRGSLFIDFFGAPTPASVWAQAPAPGQSEVRVYTLSNEAFTFASAPLPASAGALRDVGINDSAPFAGDLLLLGQAGAPVVGDPADGVGRANTGPQDSKWLTGALSVLGEGPEQTSVFGVLTGAALVNAQGQPTLNDDFAGTAILGQGQTPATLTSPSGIAPGAGGATVFGANGGFFVVGNINQFGLDDDPAFEANPATLSRFVSGAGDEPERFGDTRIATLGAQDTVPIASRLTLPSDANPDLDGVFDAGYAVTAGFALQGGEQVDAYLLNAGDPGAVAAGFDIDRSAGAVAFSGLSDPFATNAVGEVSVNFGNLGAGSAVLSDAVFGMRGVSGPSVLTGGAVSAGGGAVAAFSGQLATAGLVGDGGLFAPGVDTDPAGVRWGFWSGEIDFGATAGALDGRRDRFHLGSFLTGVQADLSLLPASVGVASYEGFALGHVLERRADGVVSYVQGGDFRLSYSFAEDAGSITISGILGRSFTAVAFAPESGGNDFEGSFFSADPSAPLDGRIAGAFFRAGAGEAAQVATAAGDFSLSAVAPSGFDAEVVGIFAGDLVQFFDPGPPVETTLLPPLTGARYVGLGDASLTVGDTTADGIGARGILDPDGALSTRLADVTATGDRDVAPAALSLTGEDGFVAFMDEIPGLVEDAVEVDDSPLGAVSFGSFIAPDVFYLRAADNADGDIQLDLFGAPTPRSVWEQTATPEPTVRAYDLSEDVFSGRRLPLPGEVDVFSAGLADDETVGSPFLVIAQPGRPLIGDGSAPLGLQDGNGDRSKLLLSYLAVSGTGVAQQSAFGVLTGAPLATQTGQPAFTAELRQTVQTEAEGVLAGRLLVGALDDGAGSTVFGPNGEFFVLSNAGAYLRDDDPDLDATFGLLGDIAHGDTRLATLDDVRTVAQADRLTGVAPSASAAALSVRDEIDALFDGGFAATAAIADAGGAATPYLAATELGADGVRAGFSVADTGVAIEVDGLTTRGETGLTDLALNFGGATGDARGVVALRSTRGAYVTDREFGARQSFGDGGVTGQRLRVDGQEPALDPTAPQEVFFGQIASAELAGVQGLFPQTAVTAPDNLRWGWWGGEIDVGAVDATQAGRVDLFHLGSFVTGVQADPLSLPQGFGEATYSGFAVAHVLTLDEAGAPLRSFVDGAAFVMTFDLGLREGFVEFLDVAGQDYLGDIGVEGAAIFGQLRAADGSGSGSLAGAFFAGDFDLSPDEAAAVAGQFDIAGARVQGFAAAITGVFGADKTVFDPLAGAQPAPQLAGALFFASAAEGPFTDVDGATVSSPIDANVVVRAPGNLDPIGDFLLDAQRFAAVGQAATAGAVRFDASPTAGVLRRDITGVDGAVIGGAAVFGDGGDFFLEARRITQSSRTLQYAGVPTDPGVWAATAGDLRDVRAYDLDRGLFSGEVLPLPAGSAGPTTLTSPLSNRLLLVQQPDGPFVGSGDGVLGPDGPTRENSRWVWSHLSIEGEAAAQRSAFGVGVDAANANAAGQPTADILMRNFAQLSGVDVATGALTVGLVDDGQGVTSYGPDGEHLVLSGVRTVFDGAEPPTQETVLGDFDGVAYVDNRLAVLDSDASFTADAALSQTLAAPLESSSLNGTPIVILSSVLDGGYAAARLSTSEGAFLAATGDVADVRFGFDVDRNAAYAEIADLSGVALNFGAPRDEGAFIDDRRFAATEGDADFGALTGQIAGDGLASSSDPDRVRAALASSQLVGDGGVFPSGTPTAPDALRWGWFSAEIDSDGGLGFIETSQIHLGAFVTGLQSDFALFQAANGLATYDGFAIGQVLEFDALGDAIASYVDGGRLRLTYDFADRAGTATLTDILGGAFTGAVSGGDILSADGAYAGALAQTSGPGVLSEGALDGRFFRSQQATTQGAVAATAGQFSLSLAFGRDRVAEVEGVFGADQIDFSNAGRRRLSLTTLFSGATHFAAAADELTDTFGEEIVDAGLNNFVLIPDRERRYDAFERITDADGGNPVTVAAISGELRVDSFAGSDAGFSIQPVVADGVQIGTALRGDVGGAFFLDAVRFDNGDRSLAFFGQPTPAAVWDTASGDDVTVRVYDVSNEVFSDRLLPVPASADVFPDAVVNVNGAFASNQLLFIPQTNGAFIGDEAAGSGLDNGRQDSTVAAAFLAIDGVGAAQASTLGVMTGRIVNTEAGQPNFGSGFRTLIQLDATDPSSISDGFTSYGLLEGTDPGETFFGADGRNAVMSSRQAFDGPAGDLNPAANFLNGEIYGDTRVLTHDPGAAFTVTAVERIALAVPVAESQLSGFADPRFDGVLDGGFVAATIAEGSDAALINNRDVGDVRFGFDVSDVAVAAEFADLTDTFSDPDVEDSLDISVHFGGGGGRDAMISDSLFIAPDGRNDLNSLTGGGISGLGETLRPTNAEGRQQGFRGALASMDFVGDGGLFAADVDTTLENVRVGWWGGELRFETAGSPAIHLGSFVAGVRADPDFGPLGDTVAHYSGLTIAHALESIPAIDGFATYVTGGDFELSYDFGLDAGVGVIADIAAEPVLVLVDGLEGDAGANFEGDVFVSNDLDDGLMRGAFFRSAAGPVAGVGGQFTAQISDSVAVTGVVAGDRVAASPVNTALTLLPGYVGGRLDADAGDSFVGAIAGPATGAEALVVGPAAPVALRRTVRVTSDAFADSFVIARLQDDDIFGVDEQRDPSLMAEIPGLERGDQDDLGGLVGDVISFADPAAGPVAAQFGLEMIATASAQELSFFGLPTPAAVWSTPPADADATQLRRYDLSNDLASNRIAPIPVSLSPGSTLPLDPSALAGGDGLPVGLGAGFGGDLLMVSEPGAALLDPTLVGETTATTQDSRWMLGYLVIDDSGAGQGSVFGVLTDRVLGNPADQPTLNNALFLSNDSDDLDAPTVALSPYGLLKDATGATAYGDQGQFLTLTNASPYAADLDDDTEPDAVLARSFVDGVGTQTAVFGDTRIAALGEALTLDATIDRLALTAPLAGSGLESTGLDAAEMTTAFTGGFAATAGYTTRDDTLVDSYLLRSTDADSVTMAFSQTRNGAVARISDLEDPFAVSVGMTIEQLNFGAAGDESAYVTDNIFAMQAARGSVSPFDGAPNSVDSTPAQEFPGSTQRAFTGALASAGLVGDGGVLPAGAVLPRNVRWGWWAGEFDFADTLANDARRRDLFHLGSFVTGVVSDIGSFSSTAKATYVGVAIGNSRVDDGVGGFVEFVGGGVFEMTYDFLTDEASASVTGFAIDVFANDISGVEGSEFSGSLESPTIPFTTLGELDGAFFAADGDDVAAVGGSFAFEVPGGAVRVSGVFAADSDPSLFVTRTITPLTGLVGASYLEFDLDGATDVDGATIGDVGGAGLITAQPFRGDPLTDFARIEESDKPDPFVRATADSSGDRINVSESPENLDGPAAFFDPDTGDAGFAFADPDRFYLKALDGVGDPFSGSGFVQLSFYGTQTPDAVWATSFGPDEVELRVYALSPDLLSGRQAPVPALTAGPLPFEETPQILAAFNHQLLLVPEPGDGVTPRPIVPDPVSGEPVSSSEWLYGRLEVVGAGPEQASYLAALTGLVGAGRAEGDDSRRQPGLSDGLWVSSRAEAAGGVATARVQQGLIGSIPADSATAGVTSFGPDGDYMVVGNLRTDFFSSDETAQVRFPQVENVAQGQSAFFGDTRLATLASLEPLATADRLPLASLYDPTTDDLFSQGDFQAGFNAGFAAANGATVQAGAVLERYTLASAGADGVLIGFNLRNPAVGDPGRDTGLSIEFAGLNVSAASIAAGAGNLGFDFFLGDGLDADTLVTDDVFAARQTADSAGGLTAITTRVEDLDASDGPRPLRPTADPLNPGLAARVVSRGLVGDGGAGVFPENADAIATNDIDTTPEYLRWGWWSGEAVYDEGDATLGGREEQLHLGSFVTGVQSDIADVRSQTGVATYEGFALGHVTETTGAQYVDGGRFTMTYDFGSPTAGGSGSVRIDGILDETVSALVALEATNQRQYLGDIVAGPDPTAVGPIGQVRGGFFRGPDGLEAPAVAATAGGFDYATTTPGGVPAAVSGVFGADRTSFTPP